MDDGETQEGDQEEKEQEVTLPEKVTIGPYTYTVKDDQSSYHEAVVGGKEDCYGWIKYAKGQIILDPDQTDQHKRATLLHEVLHGCFHVSDPKDLDDEPVVRALTGPLLDVLRRNPDLVAYLLAED